MRDKELLTLSYVTDDSTGMYDIGEISFGISSGEVYDYLTRYGRKGQQEIILSLAHLMKRVMVVSDEIQMEREKAVSVSVSVKECTDD